VEAGVAMSLQKLAGITDEIGHCNCNAAGNCLNMSVCAYTTGVDESTAGRKRSGAQGGSLDPPGLLTHLHTAYTAYSECLPTRLNPLAERALFLPGSR
jgi:hypothetical protein